MKKILILSLFLLVSCTKQSQEALEQTHSNTKKSISTIPKIKIDTADKICKQDSDCTKIAVQCSCSCGQGINKNKVSKYSNQLDLVCKNYQGKTCKMSCNGSIKCINKTCTYIN